MHVPIAVVSVIAVLALVGVTMLLQRQHHAERVKDNATRDAHAARSRRWREALFELARPERRPEHTPDDTDVTP